MKHNRQEQIAAGLSDEHWKKVKRTLYITGLAFINAILIGFIARGLIMLISFFTNLFFFGNISFEEASPMHNHLGYWVIVIPVLGGLIVGLMARFGAPAIRGHGIPEAMEKIIKGESKIHPLITILKPLSAAISIGTGGPFGAEGPIISTGGALGSFCGQTLEITSMERKVLLAAGATAGMTAIFGTPFAAILLAIELLLFEFSARSFVPVMIACVTGACMHFFLFSTGPTFPMPEVSEVGAWSVFAYAVIGLIIGFGSVLITRSVYFIEDLFEKLPFHWMWWPALGGIAVGCIGVFAPATLGVGYQNISNALTGQLSLSVLIALCFWKFLSWAIALGSGTSGGTLAPLLTIGSSMGCLLGIGAQHFFPEANVSLPLAALVGMAALFAGSARALLTSIVFAMETTMQEKTLLPLIAGCVTSFMVSFILMRTTIMTEKIMRRGVRLPDSYHPDILEMQTVTDILPAARESFPWVKASATIREVRSWLQSNGWSYNHRSILIVNEDQKQVLGIVTKAWIFENTDVDDTQPISRIASKAYSIYSDNSLQLAVEFLLKTKQDVLPVIERNSKELTGIISEHDILRAFEQRFREENDSMRYISMKKSTLDILNSGKKIILRTRNNRVGKNAKA